MLPLLVGRHLVDRCRQLQTSLVSPNWRTLGRHLADTRQTQGRHFVDMCGQVDIWRTIVSLLDLTQLVTSSINSNPLSCNKSDNCLCKNNIVSLYNLNPECGYLNRKFESAQPAQYLYNSLDPQFIHIAPWYSAVCG